MLVSRVNRKLVMVVGRRRYWRVLEVPGRFGAANRNESGGEGPAAIRMKLYLDMCVLKRPFDDQTQKRVAAETRAVVAIMDRIERGVDHSVWSTALTLENDADPDPEARREVATYAARYE